MATVCSVETDEVIGIVTLEDIIEELIQEEIMDEADLAYEYTKKAELLMKQAEILRRGISLDNFGKQRKRAHLKHHKSNSTGGNAHAHPMGRSQSSDSIAHLTEMTTNDDNNVVQLLSEEEISDHLGGVLRSSAPAVPHAKVVLLNDEDFV
jgi:hypothetical protein